MTTRFLRATGCLLTAAILLISASAYGQGFVVPKNPVAPKNPAGKKGPPEKAGQRDLFDAPLQGPLPEGGVRLDKTLRSRYQIGMIIKAVGGPCKGLYGTAPLPTEWPEQKVRIVDQEFSPQVKSVTYRVLDTSVKQMVVEVPMLNAGETATALITLEIDRSSMLGPEDPAKFVWPDRPDKKVLPYLGPSPYIECTDPKIRSLAKDILRDKDQLNAWQKVELIYDTIREKVKYQNGNLKGALAALKDGNGDCEELTSLFIAVCRASGVPARTVWVPGHCYPEFYLHDKEGKGHWFPCQAAGTKDFGGIPEHRPILQKGDKIRVPEHKDPQRYAAEYLKGAGLRNGGKPEVEFIRKEMAGN